MSQINPFGGYAAGGTQALRSQSAETARQMHRIRRKEQNAALEGDEFEPGIDNPDAVTSIQNETQQQSGQYPPPHQDAPRLDITG